MKRNFKWMLGLIMVLCMVFALTSVSMAEAAVPEHDCVYDVVYDNDNTVEPTCVEKGYGHRVCGICGAEDPDKPYVNVDPLGHIPYQVEVKGDVEPPTCVTPGSQTVTTYTWCARPGCVHVEPEEEGEEGNPLSKDEATVVIPATGVHTWSEEKVAIPGTAVQPGCTTPGTVDMAFQCTVCLAFDETSRETVKTGEPIGHDDNGPFGIRDESTLIPPTCTKKGSVQWVISCERCGLEIRRWTQILEPEHVYDYDDFSSYDVTVLQPSTCVDYAIVRLTIKCSVCGEPGNSWAYTVNPSQDPVGKELWKLYPLKDHQWEYDEDNPNYVAPTCYREGSAYQYCKVCGAQNGLDPVPIPKLQHNYGPVQDIPATCETAGGKIQECQNEGCTPVAEGHYKVIEEYPIDPDAHNWQLVPEGEPYPGDPEGAESVTRAPTCTKAGVNAYVCQYNDSHRKAEQVPALGHDWVTVPAIPATCTENGWTVGRGCARGEDCDGVKVDWPEGYPEAKKVEDIKLLVAPEVEIAKGHTILDIIDYHTVCTLEQEATYGAGYITYKCAVCGELIEEEYVEPTGHDWFRVDDDDDPETCAKDGYISWRCANCGEEKRDLVPATGKHVFSDWITEEPTCKSAGRIYRVCFTCGYEDVQGFLPVDPEAHVWEVDPLIPPTKEPTCTETGIGSQVCAVCGKVKYGTIPATGHDLFDIPGREPTCTDAGWTASVMCRTCGEMIEEPETLQPLGHEKVVVAQGDATCVNPGNVTYLCERCGEVWEEIGAYGDHTLIRWPNYDIAPTCVKAGSEAYVCYYCDYVEYRATGRPDPAGHTWVKLERVAVPTCVSGALDLYACYYCDARVIRESETEKADPNNHVWCDVGDKMACYYCDATKAK